MYLHHRRLWMSQWLESSFGIQSYRQRRPRRFWIGSGRTCNCVRWDNNNFMSECQMYSSYSRRMEGDFPNGKREFHKIVCRSEILHGERYYKLYCAPPLFQFHADTMKTHSYPKQIQGTFVKTISCKCSLMDDH